MVKDCAFLSTLEGPMHPSISEIERTLNLINSVFRLPYGDPPDMRELFPLLFSEENLENLWIYCDDGVPVSHVGFLPGTAVIHGRELPIVWVGSVCTKREYRSHGLATKLLEKGFSKFSQHDFAVSLISGRGKLYERLNCKVVGSYSKIILSLEDIALNREISIYQNWEASDLLECYRSKNVRWKRNEKEFSKLLAAQSYSRVLGYTPRIFAFGSSQVQCYWNIAIPPSSSPQKVPKVIEYAGKDQQLVHSLPRLHQKLGIKQLEVPVPPWKQSFVEQLELFTYGKNIKLKKQKERYPGSIKILQKQVVKQALSSLKKENKVLPKSGTDNNVLSRLPWPWPKNLNYI